MSDDGGDSFENGAVCNHTDHQNLFAGPPPPGGLRPVGYPNVVYYCAIDCGALAEFGTMTACSRSLAGRRHDLRPHASLPAAVETVVAQAAREATPLYPVKREMRLGFVADLEG